MPVPVKYVCPRCKGETDMEGQPCLSCCFKAHMKYVAGNKHPPFNKF